MKNTLKAIARNAIVKALTPTCGREFNSSRFTPIEKPSEKMSTRMIAMFTLLVSMRLFPRSKKPATIPATSGIVRYNAERLITPDSFRLVSVNCYLNLIKPFYVSTCEMPAAVAN